MSVPIAYLAVLLIWSTTPLGIVWSSESMSPSMTVLLRMLIALVLGLGIIKTKNVNLPWHNQAIKLYSFSALGIYGGMMFSYLAAGYLPSGVLSLVFGLSPIMSAILARVILTEPKISITRKMAMLIALGGLAIVCADKLTLVGDSIYGLIFVFLAVLFFSLSGVLVKSVTIAIHPLATTVGALSVATPLFFITWLLADGNIDISQWQARSVWATI